jgi:mRNA-degrading endonuclease YafQ of YafQ-DinJ toxin-antitoxin module
MIRVFLGSRLIKTAGGFDEELRRKIEAALAAVASGFGNSHTHSGLGLRKLAPGLWECHVALQWRIIFVQEKDRLMAYDIMNHNQVRAWLKEQR